MIFWIPFLKGRVIFYDMEEQYQRSALTRICSVWLKVIQTNVKAKVMIFKVILFVQTIRRWIVLFSDIFRWSVAFILRSGEEV